MLNVVCRLVRNTSVLLASNLIARGASAILFIVAARQLSQESVGIYSLAITYGVVLTAVASWGLDQILIRDVARMPSKAPRYLTDFFLLRLGLAGLLYGGLALALKLVEPYDYHIVQIILIIGLSAIPDSLNEICQAVFIAREKVIYPSVVSIGLALVRIGLGGTILLVRSDLILLAWVFPLTSAVSMFVSAGLVMASGTRPTLRFDFKWLKQMLVSGSSLGAINILLVLDVQAGVVLLSLLISESAVALYSAANAIFTGIAMLPAAWQMAIFPLMSRLHARSDGTFEWFYEKLYLYLSIGAVAVILGLMSLADVLILKLYGSGFEKSVVVLRIMVGILFFSFLNIPNSRLMIIRDRQAVLALFLMVSVTVNVSLSWQLIPSGGVIAAAAGRLLSSALFFLMNYWFVSRRFKQVWLPAVIARPILAGLGGIVVMLWLDNLAPLWRTAIMLLSYGALLWMSRAIPREDLNLLIRLYRGSV